jgi:HEAT repeat protein
VITEQLEKARKAIASDNPGAILFGLKMLGTLGKLTDLQQLMAMTGNPNAKIKQAAIEATTMLIKENLILHFHELDAAMRDKLGTLMQSLDPTILDEISKDIYSENEDRRLRAVQILGHMRKNPKIREVLAKLLQDRNEKVRAKAVELMGKFVGPNDHEVIIQLLNDKDIRVRANSIEALERLGNKRLVPLLLRFRRDPSNRIRGNVLKALYNLGFMELGPDLLEMIQSSNNLMKASALWVISQVKISHENIVDACGMSLLANDEMVCRNAKKALDALATPRAKGSLRYLSDDMFLPSEPTQPIAGAPATAAKQ